MAAEVAAAALKAEALKAAALKAAFKADLQKEVKRKQQQAKRKFDIIYSANYRRNKKSKGVK